MFLRRYPIARLMLIVYMVGSMEGKEGEKWSGDEKGGGVINRGRKERGEGFEWGRVEKRESGYWIMDKG